MVGLDMSPFSEEQISFNLHSFSEDDIDDFVVMLHRHVDRVDDVAHRDIGTIVHTVHVFIQAHGDAIQVGAGLATALIGWIREWRKRIAVEKNAQQTNRTPDIEIIRIDHVPVRLRDASDEEVRKILISHSKH